MKLGIIEDLSDAISIATCFKLEKGESRTRAYILESSNA